jgi:hypothetical protein
LDAISFPQQFRVRFRFSGSDRLLPELEAVQAMVPNNGGTVLPEIVRLLSERNEMLEKRRARAGNKWDSGCGQTRMGAQQVNASTYNVGMYVLYVGKVNGRKALV